MDTFKALSLMICLGLASCSSTSPQTSRVEATVATPINIGESHALFSAATGQAHELNIWTPPNIGEEGKTWPVLYVIDGGLDQDFLHIAGLAQLSTINKTFDTPIVVGIRTSNRYFQLTPTMTDSRYLPWNGTEEKPEMGGADDFGAYITETVMPFVEARYPTSQRKVLVGESLAGFYVTRMFLRSPDSFTDYMAISPSLWLDDQRLAKEADVLFAMHDDTSRNVYFTMADEGGTMQAGLDTVLAALEKRNFENVNLVYVDRRDSERHSTIYHGAVLDALNQFFGLPVPDYGPTPWYLREGGVPDDEQ